MHSTSDNTTLLASWQSGSYKTPLQELSLEDRLQLVLKQQGLGKPITPFLPGWEGKLFLIHSPELIFEVLGTRQSIFVEDKHPYSLLLNLFTPEGRVFLGRPGGSNHSFENAWDMLKERFKPRLDAHLCTLKSTVKESATIDVFPFFSILVIEIMAEALCGVDLREVSTSFFLSSMIHEDFLATRRRGNEPGSEEKRKRTKEALLEQERVMAFLLKRDGNSVPEKLEDGFPTLRAMARTFLNAYAGTATALSWLSVLLAKTPQLQDRVLQEGSDSSQRILPSIIKETLRLFPPAWMVSRQATQDTFLGTEKIPNGASVFICTYAVHRDEAIWGENAGRFIPERFLDFEQLDKKLISYYLPFGAGMHFCPGMKLALSVVEWVTINFLEHFRIQENRSTTIFPFPRVALQPEPGAVVDIAPRERMTAHP